MVKLSNQRPLPQQEERKFLQPAIRPSPRGIPDTAPGSSGHQPRRLAPTLTGQGDGHRTASRLPGPQNEQNPAPRERGSYAGAHGYLLRPTALPALSAVREGDSHRPHPPPRSRSRSPRCTLVSGGAGISVQRSRFRSGTGAPPHGRPPGFPQRRGHETSRNETSRKQNVAPVTSAPLAVETPLPSVRHTRRRGVSLPRGSSAVAGSGRGDQPDRQRSLDGRRMRRAAPAGPPPGPGSRINTQGRRGDSPHSPRGWARVSGWPGRPRKELTASAPEESSSSGQGRLPRRHHRHGSVARILTRPPWL